MSNYYHEPTAILLHYCRYPNESNWVNKPINSLFNIYRFTIPQTFAKFELRNAILQGLSEKYPQYVYALCVQILRGLDRSTFDVTARFTWRWNERYDKNTLEPVTEQQVEQVLELALRNCEWSKAEIENWLEISVKQAFRFCRGKIMEGFITARGLDV